MQSVSRTYSSFAQRVFRTRPRFAVGNNVPTEKLLSHAAYLVEDAELVAHELAVTATGELLPSAWYSLHFVCF
jgi:hypothetical protein